MFRDRLALGSQVAASGCLGPANGLGKGGVRFVAGRMLRDRGLGAQALAEPLVHAPATRATTIKTNPLYGGAVCGIVPGDRSC